jgi:hypothetical protein
MKICPICNNQLQLTYDYYYADCLTYNHYYQYFIRSKDQCVKFYDVAQMNYICFASIKYVEGFCYLENFDILKNKSYQEVEIIYNKLKVFE